MNRYPAPPGSQGSVAGDPRAPYPPAQNQPPIPGAPMQTLQQQHPAPQQQQLANDMAGMSLRPPPARQPLRPAPPGTGQPQYAMHQQPLPQGNAELAPAVPFGAPVPGQQQQPGIVTPGPPSIRTPVIAGQTQPATTETAPPNKLDAKQMPRPCAIEAHPAAPREFYFHGSGAPPPFTNAGYIGFDNGSATPRYMRLTTNQIANEGALQAKSGIPFGIVLTPFASPSPGEQGIPVVDFTVAGNGGPLRCEVCKAYANPGFLFSSGGSKFTCNICGLLNETPAEHFSGISPSTGLRMDSDSRPEFQYGSVDYLVGSKDYSLRDPKPPCYIFVIDVSAPALSMGLTASAAAAIRLILQNAYLPGANSGATVALMTFDQTLHFYDTRGDSGSATVHIVPDLDDSFLPLGGDGFFSSCEKALIALENITQTYALTPGAPAVQASPNSALGPALTAAKEAVKETGGKIFLFCGGIPTAGPGALERRAGEKAGGENREQLLLQPADPFYEDLNLANFARLSVSVDLFLGTSTPYVDTANLMRVPRASGGRNFYFPNFDMVRDSVALQRCTLNAVRSVVAFDAVVKVRVSQGLETREFLGNFGRPQLGDDINAPVMDTNSSLTVDIVHEGKMPDSSDRTGSGLSNDAAAQCAVLYTDVTGRRRIRVHTVFATKTTVLPDIFKSADTDAVLTMMAKRAAEAALAGNVALVKIRDALVEKCGLMLFIYRRHCTSSATPGQLILPEALKLLPLYVLGLMKSAAFRPSPQRAIESISPDERAASLIGLGSLTPEVTVSFCHPRMYSLGNLPDWAGLPVPKNKKMMGQDLDSHMANVDEPLALPELMKLSSEHLYDSTVLIADSGTRLTVWIGDKVDPELVQDTFVVPSAESKILLLRGEVAPGTAKSMGGRAQRIVSVVQRVVQLRPSITQVRVVLRGDPDGGETKHLMPLLIEDKGNSGGHSYVEFLRHVHRQVMNRDANENAAKDLNAWEMLSQGY